jgi:hypothetical protein
LLCLCILDAGLLVSFDQNAELSSHDTGEGASNLFDISRRSPCIGNALLHAVSVCLCQPGSQYSKKDVNDYAMSFPGNVGGK